MIFLFSILFNKRCFLVLLKILRQIAFEVTPRMKKKGMLTKKIKHILGMISEAKS